MNITLKAEYSRRYPDPLNVTDSERLNIEHHILLCRAIDVPEGISKAPNPREQQIDRGIYKKIYESLVNPSDLTFHLKNKGITVLARRVEYGEDKKTVTVHLGEGDGIADGAHTYEIIRKSISGDECPDGQFVRFEVLTGIPQTMAAEITGGLNTAVQVDAASLANLENKFDWVKETLAPSSFGGLISYKQNENGVYDIREILGLMTLFNVKLFPYPQHPKDAYVSKAKCLDLYLGDTDSYKKLKPILLDILQLHDYVHVRSRERYNETTGGRAAGMVGVYATKKRGTFDFPFIGRQESNKLYDGALYPMLGAMRFLVQQKPGEDVYSWKLKSLDEVKAFFDKVAPELVATTYKTSVTYGRKPNPIGKDENHWDNMYKTVALRYMTECAAL